MIVFHEEYTSVYK